MCRTNTKEGSIKEAGSHEGKNFIDKFIKENNKLSEISDSDLVFNDKENMIRHGALYTALLNTYVDNIGQSLAKKRQCKEEFYDLCKYILSFTCAIFFILMFLMLTGVVPTDNVSVLIGVFVSFLTVFIVIPHTIATYLFNNEEEKYMTDIIKSVQEHDVEIRRGIK